MAGRNMSKDNISKAKAPGDGAEVRDGSQTRAREAAERVRKNSKKGSIVALRLCVAALMLTAAVLFIGIWSLSRTIETLTARADRLTQIVQKQRGMLEAAQGLGGAQGTGEGKGGYQETAAGQGTGAGNAETQGADGEEDISEGTTAAHKVYLTFDDGPSANTQKILDILDKYDVKATFFVVGKEGSDAEEAMRQIVEAGHTLGMHSYTHKYSQVYESLENFAADLARQQAYIYKVTGAWSKVYRFPGGSSNTVSGTDMKEFARYLDLQGIVFFDWNVSSGDGGSHLVPVDMLLENCTAGIKRYDTSVILMHDAPGKSTTLEALPAVIEKIQDMDDTVLLPITEETKPIQHIQWREGSEDG